jgi:TusA-related sulfurtransferase
MANNESSEQPQSTDLVVKARSGTRGEKLEVHLTCSGTKHVFRFAVDDREKTAWLESFEQGGESYRHSIEEVPDVVLEQVRGEGYTVEQR